MRALSGTVAQTLREGNFVTLLVVLMDTSCGDLMLLNAGHPPPVVWRRASGTAEELRVCSNVALGTLSGFPYEPVMARLEPGDKLVLFTDGIVERCDPEGDEFGLERLIRIVGKAGDAPAIETLGRITGALAKFADGAEPHDDQTVLVVEYLDAPPPRRAKG